MDGSRGRESSGGIAVSRAYTREELDQRIRDRREEFLRVFRSRVLQSERLPNRLSLGLTQDSDGSYRLADPEAFRELLTDWAASAFIEGLGAFLDVVFEE
jgi:hypothetical protein